MTTFIIIAVLFRVFRTIQTTIIDILKTELDKEILKLSYTGIGSWNLMRENNVIITRPKWLCLLQVLRKWGGGGGGGIKGRRGLISGILRYCIPVYQCTEEY